MPIDEYLLARPGFHSYNTARRLKTRAPKPRRHVSKLQTLLILIGLGCLGYYAYVLSDQTIYQAYGNWAFDQKLGGRTAVTFSDYLREQTPFGFLAGTRTAAPPQPAAIEPALTTGSIIGRVSIDRLHLSAVVKQGVDENTLRTAVGHVPSTALAGQPGNFAIAAHRDTLFRGLKDIQTGDLVTFQSDSHLYSYKVVATKIVQPTDVTVLRADGGGLIQSPGKLLTMITCYPFYYVGSAPKRFVVEAQLVETQN